MSTVSIVHDFKTLKVKVTPGTSSTEILTKGVEHFKLDFATTGLFYNNNELPLDLPFRLLNLPAGAKLTLGKSSLIKSSLINIKIQFINSPFDRSSIVKKFNSGLSIKETMEDIEKELSVSILNQNFGLKFQSMTKVISEDDVASTTLAQLGVGNNGVLKVSFTTPFIINFNDDPPQLKPKDNTKDVTILENEKVEQKAKTEIHETKESPEPKVEEGPELSDASIEKEEIPQHVYVYKPSAEKIKTATPDESVYDLTVSHARQYQTLLAQKAHETPKLKRLREQAKQKKEISNIEVRIKFPDASNLQVNFKPTDSNRTLYDFVKSTLVRDAEEFTLVIPYPLKQLGNNDEALIKNLNERNLLIFQTKRKLGEFLKPEFLAKAKDIKEAEDVKLDLSRHLLEDEGENTKPESSGTLQDPEAKKLSGDSSSTNAGPSAKKIPKWLKLGKK